MRRRATVDVRIDDIAIDAAAAMSTWTTVRRKKGRRRGPFRDEEYCAHGHDHAHGHDQPPPERPAAWREDHEALVARLRAHPWMASAIAAVGRTPYATVRAYASRVEIKA